jgi:hypothetical protein
MRLILPTFEILLKAMYYIHRFYLGASGPFGVHLVAGGAGAQIRACKFPILPWKLSQLECVVAWAFCLFPLGDDLSRYGQKKSVSTFVVGWTNLFHRASNFLNTEFNLNSCKVSKGTPHSHQSAIPNL